MVGSNQINLTLSLDIDDVVEKLITTCKHDHLLQIIKDIDASMEDWAFTLELADHFCELKDVWEREQDVDAAAGCITLTTDIRPPKDL